MFKLITREDWEWETNRDSFFYSGGYKRYARPLTCMTGKKYLLQWEQLSRNKALENMRKYREAITLWAPILTKQEEHMWEALINRVGEFYRPDRAVWEKYPHIVKNVYEVVANYLTRLVWKPYKFDYLLSGSSSRRNYYIEAGIDAPWVSQYWQYEEENAESENDKGQFLLAHQQVIISTMMAQLRMSRPHRPHTPWNVGEIPRKIQNNSTFGSSLRVPRSHGKSTSISDLSELLTFGTISTLLEKQMLGEMEEATGILPGMV
jgi:hypothetical protein